MNGDGQPDVVLFRAKTRATLYLYLANGQLLWSEAGRTLPKGMKLVAVADMNHDGIMDYVMVNTNGNVLFGLRAADGHIYSTKLGPVLPSGYNLVAVADINRDGRPDLILFNPKKRTTKVILMHSVSATSGIVSAISSFDAGGAVNSGYVLAGVADFTGDGVPDLLFASPTNGSLIFFMGGSSGTTLAGVGVGPAGVDGYTVVGTNDFNGDGTPDLFLVRDPGHGQALQTQIRFLKITEDSGTNSRIVTQLGDPVPGPALPAGWTLVAP